MKSQKLNFNTKHVKYGGYSIAITTLLIAIIIISNLFIGKLDLKFDLTKSDFYSLSDKTNNIITGISNKVNIYVLEETGKENIMFKEILEKYDTGSDNVSVTYKDPVLYPMFAEKYKKKDETINMGSIIVECEGKFKVIDVYELYNVTYDNSRQPVIQSYDIEEKVTNGIVYVTSEVEPVVCVVNGHDEMKIPPVLKERLIKENYQVKDISILESNLNPDTDILLFMSPQFDMIEDEVNRLKEYFGKGGKAVFMLNFSIPELPNFEKILARYGIEVQKGVAFEGDQSMIYPGHPNFLMPYVAKHDITNSLIDDKIPVLFPLSMSFKESEFKSKDTQVTPLFVTSDKGYLKTNLDAKTYEKESVDIAGPLNLAMSSYEVYYEGLKAVETKLLVIGSSFILEPNMVPLNSLGNIDFVMNTFSWMSGKGDITYIRPKAVDSYKILLSGRQVVILGTIFVVILPLLIIGFGTIVWLRRRHL
ncbi:GldG family protein [Vallitalea guaymasensis]|uniref:GldG family protein n=1 Tax=Vallitalea guaymasensis TaxID=1185412 RepID=UPI000DE2802F|nr:GldG family protein [Vallitalea guaymasensis]